VSEILSSDDDDDDCEYFLDSFMRIWILMHTLSMLKSLLFFCFIIRLKAWDGKYHHVGADLCMFRYHGEVSAALVLSGVDLTGPHLHAVCAPYCLPFSYPCSVFFPFTMWSGILHNICSGFMLCSSKSDSTTWWGWKGGFYRYIHMDL
jgi:hypothetical protein